MSGGFAAPAVRDAFILAIEAGDTMTTTRLALQITGCGNPLPGLTCQALGLPLGSTYGNAAQRVLVMNTQAAESETAT